jgi:hypothetical protein
MAAKIRCVNTVYSRVINMMDLFCLQINSRIEDPCVNGDADRFRCVNYEIVLNLRIFFVLDAETEIGFSMANGMFKMKMDIERHGQTYEL